MPLGFLLYPHIFTKMLLGLHIYIFLFSLQPPLSLFSPFCFSLPPSTPRGLTLPPAPPTLSRSLPHAAFMPPSTPLGLTLPSQPTLFFFFFFFFWSSLSFFFSPLNPNFVRNFKSPTKHELGSPTARWQRRQR